MFIFSVVILQDDHAFGNAFFISEIRLWHETWTENIVLQNNQNML